jgi:hypothetical protein
MAILKEIIKGRTVDFQSHHSKEETLRRLAQLTKWKPDAPAIVGGMNASMVKFKITHAFVRQNDTAFSGRLEERDGHIVLTGIFCANLIYRVIAILFLAFIGVFIAGILLATLYKTLTGELHMMDALYLLGMSAAVIFGGVILGALFVLNACPDEADIRAISNEIQKNLSA